MGRKCQRHDLRRVGFGVGFGVGSCGGSQRLGLRKQRSVAAMHAIKVANDHHPPRRPQRWVSLRGSVLGLVVAVVTDQLPIVRIDLHVRRLLGCAVIAAAAVPRTTRVRLVTWGRRCWRNSRAAQPVRR